MILPPGHALAVAEALLGRPTWRSAREARWRSRGSLCVSLDGANSGLFYDHETGTGGDLLGLVQRERGYDFAEAKAFVESVIGDAARAWSSRACPAGRRSPPAALRSDQALRLWREAAPSIVNTAAERYLQTRGVDARHLPPLARGRGWPPGLRWHEGLGALLVGVTGPRSGRVIAVQRILLAPDGTPRRRPDGSKLKLALGPVAGNAATFGWAPSPDGLWSVAEGPESALAAAQLLRVPTYASLGAANLPRVTPPPWARIAIVVADHDAPGERAAVAAARRFAELGLKVRILRPRAPGADAADLLRA